MIYSSLAVLALAASSTLASAAMPLGNLVHLHPHSQTDTRVVVTLVNKSQSFRDVKIGGRNYTVTSHGTLAVKAPAGTVIYVNSYMPNHHVGDTLLDLSPEQNNTKVVLD
ncbi:hypothetical protein [Granulicella tundricola]|uniref:Uncharacterized protein n=1 Tax=Granulicella tundricola (strain ATCC BAA-1859 / DSM 23138 / MP5ACTX9) TaxID=1198114 RepID=E8X3X2_GRATM|nr:hypothetical protein [Granulicella tundricola]ADW70480.1 hypothetical protein AciX9_3475 [Granulicella tundricola MP5ACTX9]